MDDREAYEILRHLTSPIVAVTTRRGEKRNGMIANSAIRASLVPGRQRVAVYVFKRHLTHELVAATGRFALHVLSRDQWDEVWRLGFFSGRDRDKLDGLPVRTGASGLPILVRSFAWMECRVVNAMDAGPSTFFLGDVEDVGRGEGADVLDSAHFRTHLPAEWREPYLRNLAEAQKRAAAWSEPLDDRYWGELRASAGPGAGAESGR